MESQDCSAYSRSPAGNGRRRRTPGLLLLAAAARSAAGDTSVAAALACNGARLPALPPCYDRQPAAEVASCYEVEHSLNGTAMVQCAHGGVDTGNASDSVLVCRDGEWWPNGVDPTLCRAAPRTVWRVVARDTTTQGWWVHDLSFFTDARCHAPVRDAAAVVGSFAYGPYGVAPAPPLNAFDGAAGSVWRAPCAAGGGGVDLCGCRAGVEGWSHEHQVCLPGVPTDEATERFCAEIGDGAPRQPSGCPAGQVALGVHLASAQDVACMRFEQSEAPSLAVSTLGLEKWGKDGWEEVRRWTSLRAGRIETLRVFGSCPAYALPSTAPKWAEVLGSGSAAHGETRAIQCAGGMVRAEVRCEDGVWSELPDFGCAAPFIPGFTRRPRKEHDEGVSPQVQLIIWVVVALAGAASLIGGMHALGYFLKRRTWKRLCREGAAVPGGGRGGGAASFADAAAASSRLVGAALSTQAQVAWRHPGARPPRSPPPQQSPQHQPRAGAVPTPRAAGPRSHTEPDRTGAWKPARTVLGSMTVPGPEGDAAGFRGGARNDTRGAAAFIE